MDLALLFRALDFAGRKHRDHRRKDPASSPYVNHLISVTRLLVEVGEIHDTDVLAAAILHDTLEDTETTAEELDDEFSPAIRRIVEEVTDDKSLPSRTRKRLQAEHASSLSPQAAAVKIADKIDNVRDVIRFPPRGWNLERRSKYVEWASSVVENCPKVNAKLEACFDEVVREGRSLYGKPGRRLRTVPSGQH